MLIDRICRHFMILCKVSSNTEVQYKELFDCFVCVCVCVCVCVYV